MVPLKIKKYSTFMFLLFLWYAERHKFLIKYKDKEEEKLTT